MAFIQANSIEVSLVPYIGGVVNDPNSIKMHVLSFNEKNEVTNSSKIEVVDYTSHFDLSNIEIDSIIEAIIE